MPLSDNPFAGPNPLPYDLPDFARIRPEHLLPAAREGMAEQRAEFDRIAATEQPTFAATVEAMERSGQLLDRVAAVAEILVSTLSSPELESVHAALAPELAAHEQDLFRDRRLLERIDRLIAADDAASGPDRLDGDQRRLLTSYRRRFVRAGALLDDDAQAELAGITAEMAAAATAFERALLADTVARALHVTDVADLDGLDPERIAAARQAARDRGLDGYLLTLDLPTQQPTLAQLRRRDVRERLFRASIGRGDGGPHDTRGHLLRLVRLRARQAALLGGPTHADLVVAEGTAASPAAVDALLARIVPAAVANADAEAADLALALAADGVEGPLQPWDWAYYARRSRDDRFDLDTADLRDYFDLDHVLDDALFHAAGELYGLTFTPRPDLAGYAPDVRVHEVHGAAGPVGLLLTDWFARDSKRGGAWMDSLAVQSGLLGRRPVVVLNLNLPRPPDGVPALLTLDEVITAFHEFGHALHGLLSDVRYPSQSGTRVPRDVVEFPSQVNEMWAFWPSVLARYARHRSTGEPMPQRWADALDAAAQDGQGFATTEYLAASVLDLAWHRLDERDAAALGPDDVAGFEEAALRAAGLAHPLVPPRYRTTYFAHVFQGAYAANYFAYIWAEVLDADMVDWFHEHGGLTRENGARFAAELLSRGDSRDPLDSFAAVRGRPPEIEPLLRRRGLLPAST